MLSALRNFVTLVASAGAVADAGVGADVGAGVTENESLSRAKS